MPSATTAIRAPVETAAVNPPRGAWVIYDERNLFVGGRVIARKFYIGKVFCFDAGEEVCADTIEDVRKLLPPGMTNIGREEGDVKTVVEVWI